MNSIHMSYLSCCVSSVLKMNLLEKHTTVHTVPPINTSDSIVYKQNTMNNILFV